MIQAVVEKTQTLIKTLLGTPSDWRLTKPLTPRMPRVNYIWIGPVLAVFTIFVGWFAFTNTIGDGNAGFALFIGSVSIMMMTWSNLLSTRILPLEQIFGGVDRMYVWHRWFGALSVGAMWLHLEMVDDVKGIRGASRDIADAAEDLAETGSTLLYILVAISLLRWIPSRWWRLSHKLLVLPYAFACWHFYTSTKPYANASFWGSWFTGFMFLGLAAWIYRVLWRDMFRKGKLHTVSKIDITGNVLTIELEPIGPELKYQLGQFAFLKVKVPGLREPHPFTIASSRPEDGPTPHLFYCVPSRGNAPAIEMLEAADREGRIHLHVHASDEKNRLHPDQVISAIENEKLHNAHIVMCGPNSLVKSMKSGLRQHGARHMHVEGFDIRSGFGPDLSQYIDDLVRNQLRRLSSRNYS